MEIKEIIVKDTVKETGEVISRAIEEAKASTSTSGILSSGIKFKKFIVKGLLILL